MSFFIYLSKVVQNALGWVKSNPTFGICQNKAAEHFRLGLTQNKGVQTTYFDYERGNVLSV